MEGGPCAFLTVQRSHKFSPGAILSLFDSSTTINADDEASGNEMSTTVLSRMLSALTSLVRLPYLVTLIGTGYLGSDGVLLCCGR